MSTLRSSMVRELRLLHSCSRAADASGARDLAAWGGELPTFDALIDVSLLLEQRLGQRDLPLEGACASGAPSREAESHKWFLSITVTRWQIVRTRRK